MRLSTLGLLLIFVSGTLPAVAQSELNAVSKSSLKVLYVGPSPDEDPEVPYYLTGKSAERFARLKTERHDAFKKFLGKYFDTVKPIVASDYKVAMSAEHDVTIFDELPPALADKKVAFRTPKSLRLPDDFSYPAIMVGEVGPLTLGRRGNGFLIDHL